MTPSGLSFVSAGAAIRIERFALTNADGEAAVALIVLWPFAPGSARRVRRRSTRRPVASSRGSVQQWRPWCRRAFGVERATARPAGMSAHGLTALDRILRWVVSAQRHAGPLAGAHDPVVSVDRKVDGRLADPHDGIATLAHLAGTFIGVSREGGSCWPSRDSDGCHPDRWRLVRCNVPNSHRNRSVASS